MTHLADLDVEVGDSAKLDGDGHVAGTRRGQLQRRPVH
jgi:hypothetical protein